MKNQKTVKFFSLVFLLTLTSCGGENSSISGSTSLLPSTNDCPLVSMDFKPVSAPLAKVKALEPQTFKKDSFAIEHYKELGEGVNLNKVSLKLNSNNLVNAYVTEVNLKKAEIHAGTSNNKPTQTVGTPYSHLTAFETNNPGKKVLAITNADFFNLKTFQSINAFVKENQIVKAGHNDHNLYDYKTFDADLPASMPMMFGFGQGEAMIGSMIDNKSVKETVRTKLSYTVSLTRAETAEKIDYPESQFNVLSSSSALKPNFINANSRTVNLDNQGVLYTLKKHSDSSLYHGEITSITNITNTFTLTPLRDDSVNYVYFPRDTAPKDVKVKDVVSYNITSGDGKWENYQTILGCRQALVQDGEVAATVPLEMANSECQNNGAHRTDVPRTAIGIKEDGTLCIFSIEAMRYGKSENTLETDTYGVNLLELSELMQYYGISVGANFDGGGSTQLIINDDGENKVVTRSSDFGVFDLDKSRKVANTIIVTAK